MNKLLQKLSLCISAALLTILLPGCMVSGALDKAQVQQIKTVGVMSHMSQSFHRKYLGFTAFGNENETRFIPEAVVDRDYESQLTIELRKNDRFNIVDISGEREYLLAGNTSVGSIKSQWTPDQHFVSIDAKLKRIAEKYKLDGFFLLTPDSVEFPLTNQRLNGVGLFASGQNPEAGSS